MILPGGETLRGTYAFTDGLLTFTFAKGTIAAPTVDEKGNSVYSITTKSGSSIEIVLTADFITKVRTALEARQ